MAPECGGICLHVLRSFTFGKFDFQWCMPVGTIIISAGNLQSEAAVTVFSMLFFIKISSQCCTVVLGGCSFMYSTTAAATVDIAAHKPRCFLMFG